MVPVGATVRLEFDEQQHDRYGRTLAAAYTADGRMINAEMAKAGLVRVDEDDDSGRFHDELDAAVRDTAAARRGLHSVDIPCTLPARTKQLADALAQMPRAATMVPNLSAAELYVADRANLVRQTASRLQSELDNAGNHISWQALTEAEQHELSEQARSTEDTAISEEVALRGLAATAESRDGTNRAVTTLEAQRIAREQAALKAAQERLAAQRAVAARAAAARAAAARAATAGAATAQRQAERTANTQSASTPDEDSSSASAEEGSSEGSAGGDDSGGSESSSHDGSSDDGSGRG